MKCHHEAGSGLSAVGGDRKREGGGQRRDVRRVREMYNRPREINQDKIISGEWNCEKPTEGKRMKAQGRQKDNFGWSRLKQ